VEQVERVRALGPSRETTCANGIEEPIGFEHRAIAVNEHEVPVSDGDA
jgi:hypothetical protein